MVELTWPFMDLHGPKMIEVWQLWTTADSIYQTEELRMTDSPQFNAKHVESNTGVPGIIEIFFLSTEEW